MKTFETINPATEEKIATYTYASMDEIEQNLNEGELAFREWRNLTIEERTKPLQKLSKLLEDQKENLARLICTEMGKPLDQARAEIEKCGWVCQFYAENAASFLESDLIETDGTKSFISYEPLGVILAIMPWNFPFWQVFRFAAPTLMAGNAAVLKHSPNTTACALQIEKLFEEAGFPNHLFKTIIADIPEIEKVIGHPVIKAVTLTGSTRAGKSVAEIAGKHLKKTVLELGGSDPYLILDDAHLETAVESCLAGRMNNTGQSCIAAKRFIVTKKNEQRFVGLLKERLVNYQYGDPVKSPKLGSMARKDLRDQLHQQVQKSIEAGAECLLGGVVPDEVGYFYPATLLHQVPKESPAYKEELFGPVACVITVKDENEAIRVANDTQYGLGAAIFSADTARAETLSRELAAGSVFINDFVKSDPRLPFGGINNSGYGRELSHLGIKEFVNAKTIYIK